MTSTRTKKPRAPKNAAIATQAANVQIPELSVAQRSRVEGLMMPDMKVNSPKEIGFLRRMASQLLQRAQFAMLLGQAYSGKRDYFEVFGYDRSLDLELFRQQYMRGGISKRIIEAYPKEIWSRPPKLYDQGNAPWNTEAAAFIKEIKLWEAFKKADILCGLGQYAIILVGTGDANLETPLRKGKKILFLQPYSQQNAWISSWVRDPSNARFGMPEYYTIYPNRNRNTEDTNTATSQPVQTSFRVHASRVIHVANDALESPVYGVPRYAPVWNYLTDLMKVVGSSAESYWMTAYQGIHADIDPEMEMEETDAQDLSDEIDEYQHGQRRFIRTRGVTVKSLGSKVADPSGAFNVLMTLISGATGIPKRVLSGSEAGQLASSQDRANWAERIEEERANHCEPNLIRPFFEWCFEYEIFQGDWANVQVLWPEAFRMSPLERGQTGAQTARTIANIAKGIAPIEITPAVPPTPGSPESTNPITGEVTPATPATPGTPAVTAEALISRDEARRIIGLSTDQQVLVEIPE